MGTAATATAVIGIDVSKATFDACLLTPDGKARVKAFPNAPDGFAALLAWADGPRRDGGHRRVRGRPRLPPPGRRPGRQRHQPDAGQVRRGDARAAEPDGPGRRPAGRRLHPRREPATVDPADPGSPGITGAGPPSCRRSPGCRAPRPRRRTAGWSATGPNSRAGVWPYNSRTTRRAPLYSLTSVGGVPSGWRW